MMNLQKVRNETLIENLKLLVKRERELLHMILEHIKEVDRRKLFLRMAYPSLFDYMTKELAYSAASAQRRIEAARLMREVPSLAVKIQDGSITLTQVGEIQKALKQKKKLGSEKISVEIKKQILEEVSHKSQAETQQLVSQLLNLPAQIGSKLKVQADESVTLNMNLSKEKWQKVQRCKELLAHTIVKNGKSLGDLGDIMEAICDFVISKKDLTQIKAKKNSLAIKEKADFIDSKPIEVEPNKNHFRSEVGNSSNSKRYISKAILREVFKRSNGCTYKCRSTGKVCGSKVGLEIDHIQPVWAGGSNQYENLRVYCANHNKFRYQAGL